MRFWWKLKPKGVVFWGGFFGDDFLQAVPVPSIKYLLKYQISDINISHIIIKILKDLFRCFNEKSIKS